MTTNNQILKRMKSHNTLLCCGLDPDLKKMPIEIISKKISDGDKVFEFLKTVVDITAEHVCVYKAQKAFFDILTDGHNILKKIINYIHISHPGIPIIIDCKIGDTENTMTAYIENLFKSLQADAIVANPYMGDDVMIPLGKLTNKSIVTLVKTSNPSGSIVQDVILRNGQPLWRHILNLVINRWNNNSNMIPIISSIARLDMVKIRTLIPDKTPILLAGVGAQGGNYSNLHNLLNSHGIGVFINSSRNLLYPQSNQYWKDAIKIATIQLKESINKEKRR